MTACATIQRPTGGDKDVHAPKVEAITVQNGTTNFSGQEMSFTFNEYISLNKPQQNILISPPLNKTPNYTIKGKTLTVSWEDTLKENTTYNFYFANAIKDNNEGNDTSFSWVLSTGSFIDSLSLTAKAVNAQTGEPMKAIWLLGYLGDEIENVFKKQPDFIAQTNESGVGTFRFLPNKNIRVFALEDNNGNLRYDPGSDQIGFIDESIQIAGAEGLSMNVFSEEDTLLRILEKKYVHPGLVRFVFNRDIDLGEFWGDSSSTGIMNDTAELYLLDESVVKGNYSTNYYVDGEEQTATFYINENLKKDSFKPELKFGSTMDSDGSIVISCPRNINKVDDTTIELMKDSVAVPFETKIDPKNNQELIISTPLQPGSKYSLKIKDKAIACFFKMESDSANYMIQTRPADYYGILKIEGTFSGHIVQLLKDGKKLREVSDIEKSFRFDKLPPGKYQLRMIEDLDKNGKWSSGNLKEKRQPENVYYYPEIIDLRSGWDQEIIWNFE